MQQLNKLFLVIILSLSFTLVACGHKDSNFKEKLIGVPNTTILDPDNTTRAMQIAQGLGLDVLIFSVDSPVINQQKGILSVDTIVFVNDLYLTIRTNHYLVSGQMMQASSQLDFNQMSSSGQIQNLPKELQGVVMNVNAMCTDTNCSKYYVLIDIQRAGQEITQDGVMIDFVTNQNAALARSPGQFYDFKQFLSVMQEGVNVYQIVGPYVY